MIKKYLKKFIFFFCVGFFNGLRFVFDEIVVDFEWNNWRY